MGLLRDRKNKDDETKNIGVLMILEAVGKPPEYLNQVLKDIVTRIGNEEGVKVLSKNFNEPKVIKERENFYTTFVEVEIEVEEIVQLARIILKYMPIHMEIVYPELIALTNNGWNEIFNELLIILHRYDEVARIIEVEKKILEDKLREVLKERSLSKKSDEKKEDEKKEN